MVPHERRVDPDAVTDPEEEPSAQWGWHGTFPLGLRIAGLLTVLSLVAMMWPRDQALGRTHLFWLALPAVLILVGVLRRRRSHRR
jgi:hypothetical protein